MQPAQPPQRIDALYMKPRRASSTPCHDACAVLLCSRHAFRAMSARAHAVERARESWTSAITRLSWVALMRPARRVALHVVSSCVRRTRYKGRFCRRFVSGDHLFCSAARSVSNKSVRARNRLHGVLFGTFYNLLQAMNLLSMSNAPACDTRLFHLSWPVFGPTVGGVFECFHTVSYIVIHCHTERILLPPIGLC